MGDANTATQPIYVMQINPTAPEKAAAGLSIQQSQGTSHWQPDAWEDQNAATSTDNGGCKSESYGVKRAIGRVQLALCGQQQPSKAQKLVKVKQIKEEASDTLYNEIAGYPDAHLQKGDDIADERIQQLAWAHSKVTQLSAQLEAAKEQCAQLQTASSMIPGAPLLQGMSGMLQDEWPSEDCSTADASRVAAAAGSHSQGHDPLPLQPVQDNTGHASILKDEPVMMLHARKSSMNEAAWALHAIRGAESTLSSGEIPSGDRSDAELDDVQANGCMHTGPGRVQAGLQQELDGARDVAALAALLSTSYQGRAVNLNHRVMHAPLSSTPGSTAWRSVPLLPTRGSSTTAKESPEDGSLCLKELSSEHVVCTVSGAGTQISCGGVVVCYGSGCNVSFEDVKFSRCTIVALAGAQVTLTTSFFQNATKGLSIMASGAGTVVRMHGGSIKYGAQGAMVQEGARLQASSLTITRSASVGVEVKDKGSSVQLVDCDMHEFPYQKNESGIVAVGVRVHHNSSAHLSSLTLSGMCHGITVQEGATAKISECNVANTLQSSVTFEGGACGTVTGCTFKGSQKVCGLCVCGVGSKVEASACCVLEHAYSGVVVLKGGALTAESCESSMNKYEGYYVHDSGSSLTLKNCTSDRDLRGCGVQGEGATLTAQNTTVSNCTSDGFAAWNSGVAVLTECTVSSCRKDGVLVKGIGSRVEMDRCSVAAPHQHCAVAKSGGFLRVQGCTLAKSATGCGIRASGSGTDVEVEGCTLQENAEHAALATEEASMDVSGCHSMRHKKEAFMVWCKAHLSVTDSTSEGDGGVGGVDDEGVLCMEGIKVHMEGKKREEKEKAGDGASGSGKE